MPAIRDVGQVIHLAVAGFGDGEEARRSTWQLTCWSTDLRQIVGSAEDCWPGSQEKNRSVLKITTKSPGQG